MTTRKKGNNRSRKLSIERNGDSICAPNVNPSKIGSCLERKYIVQIVKEYNKRQNNNNDKINITENTDVLWKRLNDAMKNKCSRGDETCWIEIINPKDGEKILVERYKPKMPQGKYQWLSTMDIDNVMKQYEKKYPKFVFIGAIPRDFFGIIHKIGLQNLESLSNRGSQFGIIFNTDPHNRPGQHWLAVFIDLEEGVIEHFDSTGNPPIKEIKEFIEQICVNAFINLGKKIEKKINTKQHQRKNSECGVYSCFYIIERLGGRSFEDIVSDIKRDDVMNCYRKYIFRK